MRFLSALLFVLVSASHAQAQVSLTSPAFSAGGAIPSRYTCDGEDRSPPLAWSGVPAQAKSLALIVEDPDAPDPQAPRAIWAHWVLYDLPPSVSGLREGVASDDLPSGTREGANDWNQTGYRGPCPPVGRHRYVHKLYALDAMLPDLAQPSRSDLERAIQGHVLGEASLTATYQRSSSR